jgi:hypothetical protein
MTAPAPRPPLLTSAQIIAAGQRDGAADIPYLRPAVQEGAAALVAAAMTKPKPAEDDAA